MGDLSIEASFGQDIKPHIAQLAELRIRGFRDFPYLYAGSVAYERHYLEGYLTEPRAMLLRVLDGGQLVAAATATPLVSSTEIVADGPALFAAAGHDPKTFYYYAEILVEPSHRGRGIAPLVYAERQRYAQGWGYQHLCLAVVQREPDHPLKPRDYKSPERIWARDGFVPTDMTFTFQWPTIQVDGRVVEADNRMRFWTKSLVSQPTAATRPLPPS